jgi:hypothetical protein
MRWGLILMVAAVNVLVGVLGILGILPSVWWLSLLIGVVLAIVLGQYAKGKFFMHGFLAGLIAALINSLLVYLLWDTYVANNPAALEKAKAAATMDLRSLTLYTLPISAGIAGVVMGLLTWLAGKIFGAKKAETPPPENTGAPTP